MRILMTVMSSSLMDGVDRHILAIAPSLNAQEGIEVGVVTLHPWGDVNNALKAAGVKCWSLECANGHQLRVVPRFCHIMRLFRPDVIHVHEQGFFQSVAHKWLFPNVKRVVTIHGISDPVAHKTLRMRLASLLGLNWLLNFLTCKPSDARIFVSQGVMLAYGSSSDTESKGTADVVARVVYNPMKFDPPRRPVRQVGKRIIGTACRVESVKDPLAFTRIMGAVTERLSDVEVWVVGEGGMLAACRQLAETRGYDRMRFWGLRNDAKDLIAQMDCFVLTSKREGMPGALLEAVSAKTPIAFMSGEGGLQDLAEMNRVEGPFAVVAEPDDEAALVDGICDLLNDPAKAAAYAERAFEVGRRHFDLPSVICQLKEIYCDCLQ